MKNIIKYIGIFVIMLIGFYYTEKMNDVVINNSSLMLEINSKENDYKIDAIDAFIEDNYIVPGLNGKKVNVLKSYDNMKGLNTFNSSFLEFDIIRPTI